MISTLRQLAGVAEVVKGAGLKIRSHMGSWVRIPPPAPPQKATRNHVLEKLAQTDAKICKNAGLENISGIR